MKDRGIDAMRLGSLRGFPSQLMTAVPISREINSSRNDGPERDDLIVALGALLNGDAG